MVVITWAVFQYGERCVGILSIISIVLSMEGRKDVDSWSGPKCRETEQYNCVDVYVRVRTSDGAVASIRASPYDMQLLERYRERTKINRVLLPTSC